MLSAYRVNAHISKPARASAARLRAAAEWTEDYDFAVEF
jgi:hypothetical protein